jgi:hypothetical protein
VAAYLGDFRAGAALAYVLHGPSASLVELRRSSCGGGVSLGPQIRPEALGRFFLLSNPLVEVRGAD